MRRFGLLLIALMIVSTACTPVPYKRVATSTILAPLNRPAGTSAASETCNYLHLPTPDPNQPSLFPPPTAQEHVRGPESAYLTIIEYSDFQCPACAKFAAALAKIQQEYPQDIRVVFRDFPLITLNDKAAVSAQAAEAANLQGKFWEMHDLLFAKQAEWAKLDPAQFPAWVVQQAVSLGLDKAKFSSDLTSAQVAAIPQKAWQDGLKIKLPGAPLILVNGEILKWQPALLNNLENIIRLDLLPKRQFKSCPPYVIDMAKQYQATLKTAKGDIVIHLYADRAPNTVNNFVFLAKAGWFDNVTFYRVVPGFIAQTGDPSGTGQGNPGYFIPDEFDRTLQFNQPGMLGMDNSGPDTGGSESFITFVPDTQLNAKYTIFGQVVSGLGVLQKLTARDPLPGDSLPDGDLLISVVIEEK